VSFEPGSALREIQQMAFADCSLIESICIPSSVETIGEFCFQNSRFLSMVSFEPGSALREIHETAFFNCRRLQSIDLPPSVNVDPELLLRSAHGSTLKELPRIAVDVPVCITGDWSSEYESGYVQYLRDQTE
jgi:hypothetical protein